MKAKHIIGIVVASVAIVGLIVYSGIFDPPRRVEDVKRIKSERNVKLRRGGIRKIKPIAEAIHDVMADVDLKPIVAEHKKRRRIPIVNPTEIFSHLSGEDRKLAEALQKAADGGDFNEVLKAAKAAVQSENPEVRGNAVDALGWFGAEALEAITPMLADSDEDVAITASQHWELAISELDDCKERFDIATVTMPYISDENTLSTIAGQISASAMEYIDSEENEKVQFEKRVEVVQRLLDIIESGREAAAAAARDAYSDITGNEWLGADEAEKYLNDPDNYEAPEDNEDGEDGVYDVKSDGEGEKESEVESSVSDKNEDDLDGVIEDDGNDNNEVEDDNNADADTFSND